MTDEHSRSGVAHDRPHLVAARFLITVNRTIRACGFLFSKSTALEAGVCVVKKLTAVGARLRVAVVEIATINANHGNHGFPFAREPPVRQRRSEFALTGASIHFSDRVHAKEDCTRFVPGV